MLDAVVDFLPSPLDVPPVIGEDPRTHVESSAPSTTRSRSARSRSRSRPTRSSGKLAFFRVYSGTLKSGSYVYNATKDRKERIGRILQMHANHREEIEEVYAGDIAAAVGLKETFTGDTLTDPEHPVVLESMTFPEPVIEVKIEPKTKADQDKLGIALQRLSEEDPTFRVKTDPESGETLIAGMGELHLDVLVDRMVREFKVAANIGRPQVSYRETVRRAVGGQRPLRPPDRRQGPVRPRGDQDGAPREGRRLRVRRQDRRRDHPARVHQADRPGHPRGARDGHLRGLPGRRRQGDPLRRVVPRGRLLGDGVQDRRLHGRQGRVLEGRSRRSSSRSCASRSRCPSSSWATSSATSTAAAGHIEGMESRGSTQVVRAFVPLAQMFGYVTDLRSMTQGRASSSMEFSHYAEVPASVASELVQKSKV